MKNRIRTITARIVPLVFFGVLAAIIPPPHLQAEEPDFLPHITNTAGAIEAGMTHKEINTASAGGGIVNATDSSHEWIKLSVDGYVYHPRFMTYHVMGAGGLEQDSFTSNSGSTRKSGLNDEYDVSTTFLPEHPYNLDLFTQRQNVTTSVISTERSINSTQGAAFRYRQNPVTLQLSAINDSVESSTIFDSRTYTARGTYLIGPFMNAAGYSHMNSSDSLGTQAVRTNSYFSNDLYLDALILDSSVSDDRQKQQNPAIATIETNIFSWSEHLSADLPFRFSTDIAHDYRREDVTNQQALSSGPENAFNKSVADSAAITHKLYNNLNTTYKVTTSSSQATGGDTNTDSQTLVFSYIRHIPSGDIRMGYNVTRLVTARTGASTITSESHSTAVPGTFLLNNAGVNQSTITVMVKDPVTFNLVRLTLDTNYQVVSLGNTVQIVILSVPLGVNPPPPPSVTHDFLITYTLQLSDSKMEIRADGFNLGFTLLDGLFNPYYSRSTSNQEVVSGEFPGGADNTMTETFGYTVQKAPFMLLAEYTDFRSRLSPSRSVRTSADYREFVSEDVDVSARLLFNRISRPGTSYFPAGTDLSEEVTGMEATAHKTFPLDNLNIFGGGSYTERRVVSATTRTYALNSSLTWRIGKLTLTASASRSYTASTGTTGKQTSDAVAYNFLVSRQIF